MENKIRTNLSALFNPKSIAIVGASSNPKKLGGRPLDYMKRFGYPGKIFPINPKSEQVQGLDCYAKIADVPEDIDLSLVIVPSQFVLPSLESAAKKNCKAAIIISGGFAEVGGEGKVLQDKLTSLARETGMSLYGPNTVGFLSPVYKNYATFTQALENVKDLKPGRTGLITQSGAFGATIFVRSLRVGMGISHWAATGNEADLDFSDFLDYMVEDPDTDVISGFMAGIKDGPKLVRALDRAAEKKKPVVILKLGSTEAGQKAAYSHTGTMVGSGRAYEAIFKQKGVIMANNIAQFLDYSMALATTALPKGRRVGIMTESGGGGVLLTERCSELGLKVPEPGEESKKKLSEVVPDLGSVDNPIDLTGQSLANPKLIKQATEVMYSLPDFDFIVPMLLMSEDLGEIKSNYLKNLCEENRDKASMVVCWPEGPKQWVKYLMDQGVHVSVTPTRCAQTMHALVQFGEFIKSYNSSRQRIDPNSIPGLPADRVEMAKRVINDIRTKNENRLNEYEGKLLLKAYGIPVVEEAIAETPELALEIGEDLGFPLVVKIVSKDIPHKTEAGVIRLGISSSEELEIAVQELLIKANEFAPGAKIDGILLQKMAQGKPVETIVGITHEEPFGPALMFGLGGIFVEVLKDVAIRMLPTSQNDIVSMLDEIKGAPILNGVRGQRPADKAGVVDTLIKTALLAQELSGEIAEIDINPLLVMEEGEGVMAVDALVLLEKRS